MHARARRECRRGSWDQWPKRATSSMQRPIDRDRIHCQPPRRAREKKSTSSSTSTAHRRVRLQVLFAAPPPLVIETASRYFSLPAGRRSRSRPHQLQRQSLYIRFATKTPRVPRRVHSALRPSGSARVHPATRDHPDLRELPWHPIHRIRPIR